MKVKEAVEQIIREESSSQSRITRLSYLYKDEMFARITLRAHGKNLISQSLADGVVKEMDSWILKVAIGVGLTVDQAEDVRRREKETATTSMKLAARRYHANH